MSRDVKTYEGLLTAPGDARFAIVASRFNHFIVDRLVDGAIDCLVRHGVGDSKITITRTPGAWELPLAVQRLAASKKFDAVIALSAVIRGSTPHFDYVAGEAAKGAAHAMLATGVPIAFGVLTTDTLAQAEARARAGPDNKGREAAAAAIEMAALFRRLGRPPARASGGRRFGFAGGD